MKKENLLPEVLETPKGKTIRFFKHGYKNGWELNIVGNVLNLRIAKYQFSFWVNNNAIINLTW